MTADQTRDRNSQTSEQMPVIVHTSQQLHIFRCAYSAILDESAYQDILARFQKMRNFALACYRGEADGRWSESANMISLVDECSHWVGHDDTLYTSIELSFSREEAAIDNVEWSADSDWPCSGQYLLFDKSFSENNSPWDYNHVTHKTWLLKEPYGLPGIWRFEYHDSEVR